MCQSLDQEKLGKIFSKNIFKKKIKKKHSLWECFFFAINQKFPCNEDSLVD